MRVHRWMRQIHREQVHLAGISKSLNYQQFNHLLAVSYILPNYWYLKHTVQLATDSHCFLVQFHENWWSPLQETGEGPERCKLSQWPQETDIQYAEKDTRTKFIKRQIRGKYDYFISPKKWVRTPRTKQTPASKLRALLPLHNWELCFSTMPTRLPNSLFIGQPWQRVSSPCFLAQ